jgi:hypothetical protein
VTIPARYTLPGFPLRSPCPPVQFCFPQHSSAAWKLEKIIGPRLAARCFRLGDHTAEIGAPAAQGGIGNQNRKPESETWVAAGYRSNPPDGARLADGTGHPLWLRSHRRWPQIAGGGRGCGVFCIAADISLRALSARPRRYSGITQSAITPGGAALLFDWNPPGADRAQQSRWWARRGAWRVPAPGIQGWGPFPRRRFRRQRAFVQNAHDRPYPFGYLSKTAHF